ncbi:MAG: PilN domain-containing protein [Desulfobacterales bacterium]|nr:PilN domain-containing protein [Desulfobacterales bacterium]
MIKINLLKDGILRNRNLIKRRVLLFSCFLMIITVGLAIITVYQNKLIEKCEVKIKKRIVLRDKELEKAKKASDIKKKLHTRKKKIHEIDLLKKSKQNYMDIIGTVAKASIISNTQLTEFSIGNKKIVIEGYGYDTLKIASFIKEVKSSKNITKAHLKTIERNTEKNILKLKFKIICIMNI